MSESYTPLSREYLAGFFDGEGCVGVYSRNSNKKDTLKYFVLVCSVSQKGDAGKELLDRIKLQFEGSIYRNGSGVWQWTTSANKADTFIRYILPFSNIKQPQLLKALSFQELPKKTFDFPEAVSLAQDIMNLKRGII